MAIGFDGLLDRPVILEFPTAAALTATFLIVTKIPGEAFPRFILKGDGTILKGNGTVAPT